MPEFWSSVEELWFHGADYFSSGPLKDEAQGTQDCLPFSPRHNGATPCQTSTNSPAFSRILLSSFHFTLVPYNLLKERLEGGGLNTGFEREGPMLKSLSGENYSCLVPIIIPNIKSSFFCSVCLSLTILVNTVVSQVPVSRVISGSWVFRVSKADETGEKRGVALFICAIVEAKKSKNLYS